MNVVIWARVSSREQREGYSIDAQLRADREKAHKAGWYVVREFVVAESAKRGAERIAFNKMLQWVKAHAKRQKIRAILSHKLDRVCRNMRDAVRLQDLEDTCGVQLAFVENQFGPGAAGALSFNVMAAVAQYYSDNLRAEVLKGMDEKVRQGWPTGLAAFGYINVKDNREEPVQPHPEKAKTLIRIFELYARGDLTFESLADQLEREGHTYSECHPRFNRTTLSHILNNRFYIGELRRNGQVFPGKYRLLIDRRTFDRCQDVLHGRNRRTGNPALPLSGGLFECAHCGQSITGELIRRRLRDGNVREHVYYRCANNSPGPDHPRVRWRAEDLERAVVEDLAALRLPSPQIADWFRHAVGAAFSDLGKLHRDQAKTLQKRQTELKGKQDRLLEAYLSGLVDEETFHEKSAQLRGEIAATQESLEEVRSTTPEGAEAALAVFDWSQNAAEHWRGSNNAVRREILEFACLNRTLSDVSLVLTKTKPFDILAEGPENQRSRGDWIRTSDLLTPSQTRYPGCATPRDCLESTIEFSSIADQTPFCNLFTRNRDCLGSWAASPVFRNPRDAAESGGHRRSTALRRRWRRFRPKRCELRRRLAASPFHLAGFLQVDGELSGSGKSATACPAPHGCCCGHTG